MGRKIRFSAAVPGCDRIHHVNENDVGIVLGRLPTELWSRLRAVHFNDKGRGADRLGYATPASREITLCALPPRVSFARFRRGKQTPNLFGARRDANGPLWRYADFFCTKCSCTS